MVKMIDNYLLSEVIGEGSYGKVYRSTHLYKPGQFAIKAISNEKLNQNKRLYEFMQNQVNVLSSIDLSQHIVKYFEMIRTKNNLYFVYEYCNGGTLMDKIKRQGRIYEKQALNIFEDLISAFKILNRNNIMHRDVKPENILFHDGKVKLGDFGFCKDLKNEQNSMAKTMLGSPIYMAPQVLKGQRYTTKADIWSLGVIFYEMLYGNCPFESSSIAKLINTINQTQLDFPNNVQVSFQTKSLIKKMLSKNPYKRIMWAELFDMKCSQCSTNYGSHLSEKILDSVTTTPLVFGNVFGYFSNQKQKKNNTIDQTQNQQFQSIKQQAKKPSSLGKYSFGNTQKSRKQDKKNIFYSQNYMDILLKPQYKQKISNTLQIYDGQINNNCIKKQQSCQKKQWNNETHIGPLRQDKKRDQLLKKHDLCMKIMTQGLNLLKSKQKCCIQICYLTLNKVLQKLREIISVINLMEMELIDISSIISFQMIQVDRLAIETKQELLTLKKQIPAKLTCAMRLNTDISPEMIQFLQGQE